MKLKISEFAAMTGVSVRTLRYYDEIGLLKPAQTDKITGYRFYDDRSLETLKKILYYRDLDFPLKEIPDLLSRCDAKMHSDLLQRRKQLLIQKVHLDHLIDVIDNELSQPVELDHWFDKVLDDYNYSGFSYKVDDSESFFVWGNGVNGDNFTLESRFNIGELTMQFTAFCILLLEDKGLLKINDTIEKYLPDCIYADRIRISHLLEMKSGISRKFMFERYDEMMKCIRNECKAVRHYIVQSELEQKKNKNIFEKIINYAPLEYESGENLLDYEILAFIAESVSGMPIEMLYKELIFKPLEMNNTSFGGETDIAGYIDDVSVDIPNACNGSKGIITTAGDMFKWYSALLERKLLSDDGYKKMFADKDCGFTYGLCRNNAKFSCEGNWGEVYTSMEMDFDKKEFYIGIRNKAPVPDNKERVMYFPVKNCDDGYVKLEVWYMQAGSSVKVNSVKIYDENAQVLFSDSRDNIINVKNCSDDRHAEEFSDNYFYELDMRSLLKEKFSSEKSYIIEARAECSGVKYAQLGMVYKQAGEWQNMYYNVFYQYESLYSLFMESLNTACLFFQ